MNPADNTNFHFLKKSNCTGMQGACHISQDDMRNDKADVLCCNTEASNEQILLQMDYMPGCKDVICGRGKKCYGHVGNRHLRRIVARNLKKYSAATSKQDKSDILSSIIAQVRSGGGFVKKDTTTGQWYDVGDFLAREKVSQAFRDALHENYKSSTVFKRARRQERRSKVASRRDQAFESSLLKLPLFTFEPKEINGEMDSASSSEGRSQNPSILGDTRPALEEPDGTIENISFSKAGFLYNVEDPFEPIPISQQLLTGNGVLDSQLQTSNVSDNFEPIQHSYARTTRYFTNIDVAKEQGNGFLCF